MILFLILLLLLLQSRSHATSQFSFVGVTCLKNRWTISNEQVYCTNSNTSNTSNTSNNGNHHSHDPGLDYCQVGDTVTLTGNVTIHTSLPSPSTSTTTMQVCKFYSHSWWWWTGGGDGGGGGTYFWDCPLPETELTNVNVCNRTHLTPQYKNEDSTKITCGQPGQYTFHIQENFFGLIKHSSNLFWGFGYPIYVVASLYDTSNSINGRYTGDGAFLYDQCVLEFHATFSSSSSLSSLSSSSSSSSSSSNYYQIMTKSSAVAVVVALLCLWQKQRRRQQRQLAEQPATEPLSQTTQESHAAFVELTDSPTGRIGGGGGGGGEGTMV
ncbi:hypothetical protein ACA910_003992 [Epithemia clementina (nom. ined.)]